MPELVMPLRPLAVQRVSTAPARGEAGRADLPRDPALSVIHPEASVQPQVSASPLWPWVRAVETAQEPCLVLDPTGAVVALSPPAATLLGCERRGSAGRPLLDVLRLVPFDPALAAVDYAPTIPPLRVLTGGGLARGLLRVEHPDGTRVTIDAVASVVRDAQHRLLGCVSFLAPVVPG